MPRRCTAPARCSGSRNRWPARTHAGTPDNPERRSGPPPVPPLQLYSLPKSPKLKCASEPPSGLAAAVRLQLSVRVVLGVNVAIGVAAGGGRLALLVARKTAIAAACAEI